jgi:hypothetical protein
MVSKHWKEKIFAMKTLCRSCLVVVCLVFGCAMADGLPRHDLAAALIENNPIVLKADGIAALPFSAATTILMRDDFLEAIQCGYARTLPPGEEPEFEVHQTGPGRYQFLNCHQQQTEIEEVERVCQVDQRMVISLYTTGERFFGPFQSFCRVEIWPEEDDSVGYRVKVYARPESATIRFLARISPVEMFFRHKTRQLTGLVVDVCEQILLEEDAPQAVERLDVISKGDHES